jgi:hypothetical protein
MSEVVWERLSSGQYEDMVSVLLSHLNPRIRRIDGSGGDGGRDSEFPREDGPEIFQLKKFTGRMNGGRRGQVKSSLKTAARRKPVAWHLVVPIDPTPGEGEWFEGLRKEYDFPLHWDGKTWLDAQMAERPFIQRYFLTDERDRVMELLKQLHEEQAAIEDVQAGAERMRGLAARINELDPYYRFDIAIRNNDVSIGVFPKYEGAELDHPITVKMNLAFPDTDEGHAAMREVQASMDYGSPVEVEGQFIQSFTLDGPGGIGGTFTEGGAFKFGPPEPRETWEMPLELRALTSDGVQVAVLPITLTQRTMGLRGAIVRGSDRPGTFTVEMQANVETQHMSLHFRFSATADHFPHDLLPALVFMRGAVPPNMIEVLVGPDRMPLGEPVAAPDVFPLEEGYVRLVEDLARLQRETGTFFPMPPELTQEDLREIAEGLDLLDGKDVDQRWKRASFELNVTDPQRLLEEFDSKPEGVAFFFDGHGEATVAGHMLPLGKMRTYIPAAHVANLEELRLLVEAAVPEEELVVEMELEASGEETFKLKLIPE